MLSWRRVGLLAGSGWWENAELGLAAAEIQSVGLQGLLDTVLRFYLDQGEGYGGEDEVE